MTKEQEQILKSQFVNLAFSREWKEKLDTHTYSDNELICYCMKKAWPDAIIYVRKKNTPEDEKILRHEKDIKGAVYNSIVNAEWKEDFDKWHDELCQKKRLWNALWRMAKIY